MAKVLMQKWGQRIGLFIGLLLHIFSLNISPLPEFDEVVFADISYTLHQTGEYRMSSDAYFSQNNCYVYGPVYFQIQRYFLQLGGCSPFWARLPSLLSLGVCLLFFYKIAQKTGMAKGLSSALLMFYLFDFIVFRDVHTGRMDTTAVAFCLGGILAIISYLDKKERGLLILAGVLLAMGYLTTPRVIFILLGVPFFFWKKNYPNLSTLVDLGIMGIAFGLSGCAILWLGFGNISDYFFQLTHGSEEMQSHIGAFTMIRYPLHLPLYVMLIFLIGWGMFKKLAGMAGWIIIILGFNLIVVEAGPYEGMAIPFYLLCIGIILTNGGKTAPTPLFIFLKRSTCLLTIGYIALFFVKLGLLVTDYEYRRPRNISHVIAQHIPPQSHVLSDLIYYYSLRENRAVLQCLFPFNGGNFESRAQFYKEKFDFDYFVFTTSQIDDDSFEDRTAPIMRAFEMEKIAEIHADDSPRLGVHAEPILGKILASLLHSHTPYTYHGYIYKRIRR